MSQFTIEVPVDTAIRPDAADLVLGGPFHAQLFGPDHVCACRVVQIVAHPQRADWLVLTVQTAPDQP